MTWRRANVGAAVVLAALTLAACTDRGVLFDPDRDGVRAAGPTLTFGDTEQFVVYEGDTLGVALDFTPAMPLRAEALIVDGARTIVWRSPVAESVDSRVELLMSGLPEAVVGDTTLRLTVTVVDYEGRRYYASEDTVAAVSLREAAVRPVVVYRGGIWAEGTGTPQSFAFDPVRRRLYFANPDRAEVGVFDVEGSRVSLERRGITSGPVDLAFRHGRLAALIADGTELVVFDRTFGEVDRQLLPVAALDVLTLKPQSESEEDSVPKAPEYEVERVGVRPYAAGLAIGCGDAACEDLIYFARSEVTGTQSSAQRQGVLRRAFSSTKSEAVPLVVPWWRSGLVGDSVALRVDVLGADKDGRDALKASYNSAFTCVTLALGSGAIATSPLPSGPVYAATAGVGGSCGEGTAIVRIDNAGVWSPDLSMNAARNMIGENRISEVRQLAVSPDGKFVLARTDAAIHLLDQDLRLRGTVPVKDATAVAWVEGTAASAPLFGVARADGVVIYEPARMTAQGAAHIGPTRSDLLVMYQAETGEVVTAAVPADRAGIALARVQLESEREP